MKPGMLLNPGMLLAIAVILGRADVMAQPATIWLNARECEASGS